MATFDSSMSAPDCTDLTSGDQCKVMCTAGYTGGASVSLFWNLVTPIVQTVTRPSTSHLSTCLVAPMAFLAGTLRHFYPVGKALSCPSSALLDDDTMEDLDCCLTWGEACVGLGSLFDLG